MKRLAVAAFILCCGLAQATTVETNGTVVTITADAAYMYTDRLDSSITELNLTGGQEITLAAVDNSFAGTVNLTAGKVVFVANTFSAGATIDGATLNAAANTYAVMNLVVNPIPWKLVVTSGIVHLVGRGALGSVDPRERSRWAGTVSIANGAKVYMDGENGGTTTYGISGTTSASANWITGAIEGQGAIYINETAGKGVLGFGNKDTVKSIGGFAGLWGSFRMQDAGKVVIGSDYWLYRNTTPENSETRLTLVGDTFVTTPDPKTIGYTGYNCASYLDVRDGAVVSNRIDLGNTALAKTANQGTLFLTSSDASKPSRAYFCRADGGANVIGNAQAPRDGVPSGNDGSPGSGYVMLRNGIAEFDRPVELGRSSRGFIDIREGGQVITRGTDSTWCVGGHQRRTPFVTDACHGAIRVGAGGLFKSESDILLTYGTRTDIGGGAEMRDVGYGEFTVSGEGATAEVREIALMFGRQWASNWSSLSLPGSVGFVNIRNGGVLTASRIYRDSIESDLRQTGKTTDQWGAMVANQYAKSCLYLTFAGGTLKVASSGRFFIPLSGQYEGTNDGLRYPTRVTVYSGGATIDTDGHDVIWDVPIVNANGKIVANTGITMPAAYYSTHPPRVRVLSKTGDGHASSVSVWANYANENNRSLPMTYEVTSPGFNQTTGDLIAIVEDGIGMPTTNTVALANSTGQWSGVPDDSYSFTKKGAGTLTLKGANTWVGPTRIDAGTLAFTDAAGLPATTVEIASSALAGIEAPLKVKAYTGGEIHIVGATLNDTWFQKQVKVLESETAMTQAPTVKLYDKSGAELDTSDWVLSLSSDGKRLWFGKARIKELTIANADTARGTIAPTGVLGVIAGDVVTVTATPNNHALAGWNVNGEFVAASGLSYDYHADLTKDTLALSPVFSTNLYVNASDGNDASDGMTPATAKKTLVAICANAIAGDVIHAAEGDYDEGEAFNCAKGASIYIGTSWADMYSRVKVPDNVTLKADGAREKTMIWGRWHSTTQSNGPVYNNGTVSYPATPNNALRGVMLGHNSVLDGFTVTNGCATGSQSGIRDDNAGGGIIGFKADDANGASYVRNCTITGSGERNGAVSGCQLENCYLYGNDCTSSASCCIYSRLVNCLIYSKKNSAIEAHRGIYGSTIIEEGLNNNKNVQEFNSTFEVVNTILNCPTRTVAENAYQLKNWRNCIVPKWSANTTAKFDDATCSGLKTNALAECLLDSGDWFAPKSGSPAIDAGDASLMDAVGGLPQADYRGGQRVYNAKVDIGCNEYAPFKEFGEAVCGNRAAVFSATPMTELKNAKIEIPDGDELGIRWSCKRAGERADLEVALAQGAALKVYAGDVLLQTIDASGICEIHSPAPAADLRLVADGGTATLVSFKPAASGMVIFFK